MNDRAERAQQTRTKYNVTVSIGARAAIDALLKTDNRRNGPLRVRAFQRTHWRAFQSGIHFARLERAPMFELLERIMDTQLQGVR
ncbi:unnamed protein product [Danaus chrysippus]|uniref:(African queen) hypothetical protein n=1 Tax=Danaus chrysippus TaxID=151541 RepID=A0A8J2QJI2_9NEOP|nr:unnamed protein product [Danaus chrysippus]